MVKNEYIALRRQEVNTFNGIVSSVMGWNLDRVLVLPFLWINIVQAFFYSEGMVPDSHTARIRSVQYVLKTYKQIKIDI